MSRRFSFLSYSRLRLPESSNLEFPSHVFPIQLQRDTIPKPKSHLPSPFPLEQHLPACRIPLAHNPKPQQEPNHLYEDIAQRFLDPGFHGDAHSLFQQLIKKGFAQDVFLVNNLVNRFAKTDRLDHAHQLFDEMPEKNSVSWTCLISGYTQQRLPHEAFRLFKLMLSSSLAPTQFTFGSILRACQDSGPDWFVLGTQIHGLIIKHMYSFDTVVCNSLISMYGSCCLESARYADEVFNSTLTKNIISWNSIISVHSQRGNAASAFQFFSRMQKEEMRSGFQPNEYTFGSLISVSNDCSSSDILSSNPCLTEQMLARVSKSGFLSDLYVGSALVSAFARFGLFHRARKIFMELSVRNAVSVNGLMLGFIKQNRAEEAVELFKEVRDLVVRNDDSHVVLLSALTEFENLNQGRRKGREVHGFVIRIGLIDCKIAVSNGLVNMYSKCRAVEEALRVFERMTNRDQISWNSVISGLDQNGLCKEALISFSDMMKTCMMPSNFAIISTLSSCASLRSLRMGSQVHCVATKVGLDSDISVSNSLITMYAEGGSMSECQKIFGTMTDYDQISWNSMLGVLANSDAPFDESLKLFSSMMQSGWKPNRVTFVNLLAASTPLSLLEFGQQIHALAMKFGMSEDIAVENALILIYAKSGDMNACEFLFAQMPCRRDEVSWNSMVAGYVHNGLFSKAMDFAFLMMQSGENMDCFTYTTVLSACASVAALDRGMEIHAYGVRSGLKFDVILDSSLIDMYSKCGRIDYAHRVFFLMPSKNEYSWNSMISAFARHGQGEKALQIFKTMQNSNLLPDHVTFVGVLSACSHAGLVEEGLDYFESMSNEYGLIPRIEHYSCIVDLLGRAGEIDKMEHFVKRMPMKPNILIWRTVLVACIRSRKGTETNLFKQASDMVLELEPDNPVNYVLVSHLYASKGRWDHVAMARTAIRGAPVKKEAGCSWVVLRDGIHVFLSGDRSHPEKDNIYKKLDFLNKKMKDAGYVPQIEFALYDLEMESKEELLSYHSEKLAVAFVLTRSSGLPIRIMKNLRVCGDCHLAFCYISKIVGRQIILRDSNRFHHFADGKCSCGDFW
ncbi:Putative pentatricopeptide repeat-containing protein [Apostasia shenzhenica]|uniref:Pentatricopeptide repeat-containing protein n=1 Tax=Apostasia shenzhenica TaxID=1088818 RepID=A0A2H9ZWD8_9ASPA|nr:Putative pentatricopeptide repeat-containing protein [Apostasia shenzhenica]